jgi:MFS family permease
VKEGEQPPPDTAPDGKPRSFLAALRIFWRECFSHNYYRWLTASVALTMMAFVPVNTFSIKFAYAVNMPIKMYGVYSAAQLFCSLIIAYPIGYLADRFHPLRLIIVSLILHGMTVTFAFFFVRNAASFGVFHVLTGACAGCWLTAYQPSLPLLLPRAKYATMVSGITVASSIGTMMLAPACGWFLDHVVNHEYRYIYLWTVVFDAAALMATLVVYQKFNAYGGRTNYVAPEV